MNLAVPTPSAPALDSVPADSQGGLLPVPASNQSSPNGSVLDLPLFIDVLAQVLPSSVMSAQTVAQQQDAQVPSEPLQDITVGPEPSPDSVFTEGTDLDALPAAWGQSAWGSVAGAVAVIAADAVQGTRKPMPDEEAQLFDPAAAGVSNTPVMPLPNMSLLVAQQVGLDPSRGVPAQPSQEALGTVSTIGSAGRSAPLLASAELLASMAPPMVRQPVAEGSVTTALGEQAPMPLVSDRAAALIQSAAALPQTGDTAQPLALNPRQPDLWQRPLAQALGERLQVQGAQGEEQALIRLDPPSLGRVEILLRQEGGGWQVQLSATHPEVSRQLQAISETLRHELSVRQQASVSVQVTSDHLGHADGRQQRHRQDGQQPRGPGRAWDGDEAAQTFDLA